MSDWLGAVAWVLLFTVGLCAVPGSIALGVFLGTTVSVVLGVAVGLVLFAVVVGTVCWLFER